MEVLTKKDVIEELNFKVVDKVTFTNSNGVVFKGHTITGLCDDSHILYQYGNRYLLDIDCYWMPVKEESLIVESVGVEQI